MLKSLRREDTYLKSYKRATTHLSLIPEEGRAEGVTEKGCLILLPLCLPPVQNNTLGCGLVKVASEKKKSGSMFYSLGKKVGW